MDRQYKVGIVGATGMVGQRFVTLLENHPWFKLTVLAASGRSAGKSYEDAVGSRWAMTTPMPESVKKMTVLDASKVEEVASQVDFVFCAVNMPKDEIKALEEAYAKAECPVVSNNSAHRFTSDVPMVVPEINADHIEIIPAQRKRLGTKRGFIAVKSNCSLQSYVPALHPLMKDFGVSKALVCTYQAISGAGKTFDRMPEIVDNVIPYIGGEEEKSEREPLKLWGHIEGDQIVNAEKPTITAQCFRVPVSDGHTAAVFVSFDKKPTKEQMLEAWANFRGPAQELNLPSAPKQFLHYFEENDRPQPKLDRNTEHGMAVCIGRLREDTLFDYKFACMSHNTLRGAAGGAVLLALLEWSNPRTMGGLSVPGKIMAALFQSVSTRTAGMNTVDLASCGTLSKLLMSVLQFIGAAPGSTGGGVKVTTFAVIILTIRSVAQGRDDCVIADHHIESKTVYRALTIIVIGALAAFGSAVVVYYNTSDAVSVIDAIFESCSAFGTVGLSVGVTARLKDGAKLLYMAVMFMGRVGPVSLAMSLTAKPDDNKRKIMPVGHINVG